MPEERKTFTTYVKYWSGALHYAWSEHRLAPFIRGILAVMIAALFKLWLSGLGTIKDVFLVFFCAAIAYVLLLILELLARCIFIAPVGLAAKLESENTVLKQGQKAREADVPRLEILSPKNEQTRLKRDNQFWLCRIAVRNLCQSVAAEGVKVKVQKVTPYKFPVYSLPSYLVRKGQHGAAAGTVEKLGPLEEQLFDLLVWDAFLNFGLELTEPHGHMVKLNDGTQFPANECELFLEASGDNCTPVLAHFKLRWDGQGVKFTRLD